MILYVTSSYYPSVEANLVHVLNQVHAFIIKDPNTKFVISSNLNKDEIIESIFKNYGLKFQYSNLIIFKTKNKNYKELKNAYKAFIYIFISKYFKNDEFIISRNLLFSFFYFGKNLVTEFHTINNTVLRFFFQKQILKRKNQKKILISKRLHFYLSKNCLINNYIILHDSAESFVINIADYESVKNKITTFFKIKQPICIYTGSLHKGRGIEIIIELAKLNKNLNFLIIGSKNNFIVNNNLDNIYFLDYIPYIQIKYYLINSNILLMPYQDKVSINVKGQDTSKWMSPLKLFEYMSVKKPIISSNLPVLREVLKSNYNCNLVKYNNIIEWNKAINKIYTNQNYAKYLSNNAYNDFINNYTWEIRAIKIYNFYHEI
jgi:glycosyltransferase involved in cell wall biosynthesis